MTFADIDEILMGCPGAIVRLSRSWAEKWGFARAYSRGKKSLATLVGWDSPLSALSSPEAYDIVIGRLIEQCEKGDEAHRAKMAAVIGRTA